MGHLYMHVYDPFWPPCWCYLTQELWRLDAPNHLICPFGCVCWPYSSKLSFINNKLNGPNIDQHKNQWRVYNGWVVLQFGEDQAQVPLTNLQENLLGARYFTGHRSKLRSPTCHGPVLGLVNTWLGPPRRADGRCTQKNIKKGTQCTLKIATAVPLN